MQLQQSRSRQLRNTVSHRLFSQSAAAIGVVYFFAFLASNAYGQFPSAETVSKSVVRLEINRGNGSKSIGTGFAWSKPNWVVTALHVVAGARDADITVFVQNSSSDGSSVVNKSSNSVKLLNVLLGADLALLEVTGLPQLTPLTAAFANPAEQHEIWGFPLNIPALKEDEVKFSKGLPAKPTFSVFFGTFQKFQEQVGADGFPKYDNQILRVSDTIQPGHSGAPIINRNGQVVGIADGGLYEGVKRINWAIPAAVYLPDLEKSREPRPAKVSALEARYGLVTNDPNKPKDIAISVAPPARTANSKTIEPPPVFRWSFSSSFADIIKTADKEDTEGLRYLIDEARKDAKFDLSQSIVDVYEEDETGATVALPRGVSVLFDAQKHLLRVSSKDKNIEMLVQVVGNDTMDDGLDILDGFEEYMESLDRSYEWKADPDRPEFEDGGDFFYSLEKNSIQVDQRGVQVSQMFANLDVDDGDFLGTAVIARNLPSLQPDDLKLFYLMMACVEVSGFPID